MIDYFAIGLSHALLALAALRLMARADLDSDEPERRRRATPPRRDPDAGDA